MPRLARLAYVVSVGDGREAEGRALAVRTKALYSFTPSQRSLLSFAGENAVKGFYPCPGERSRGAKRKDELQDSNLPTPGPTPP